MPRDRLPFRLILVLGLVTAIAWHAPGAIDATDARHVAAHGSGVLSGRLLDLGADLVRLVDTRFDPFQARHLAAGIYLAVAAALSAAAASRRAGLAADRRGGAALAAGLFVGGAVLFGADLGGVGRTAAPLAVPLALLAGSLWCAVRDPARPLAGGLLAGLAVAAHPVTLLFLPGLLLLPARSGALPRALAGVVLGSLALHLPPPGGGFGGAIPAWWASGAVSLSPAGSWGANAAALGAALLRNAGPVGIVLGALALFSRRTAGAALSASAVVLVVVPAAAFVLAAPSGTADARVPLALTAWAFLFWSAPAFGAVAGRLPAMLVPGIAVAAGAGLLYAHHDTLDRSAEPTTAWAAQTLDTLPDNALLLADNPVHHALARLGNVPEGCDVAFVAEEDDARVRERVLRALAAPEGRPVMIDAALFFDTGRRAAVLGTDLRATSHGLSFRVSPRNSTPPDAARGVWQGSRPDDPSPRSPLRDGLTVREYYGRGFVQSGYLHEELRRFEEAERDFLFALSLGEPNPTLAALGLARVQIQQRNRHSAIRTLEDFARVTDEGAWVALELLADCYRQEGRAEEAVAAYRRARTRLPAGLTAERQRIERKIAAAESG